MQDKYGSGLQDVSIPDAMTVYGAGQLGKLGVKSLSSALESGGILRNEMGSIFPEGVPIPKEKILAKELSEMLPESQANYRRNEALANWHAQNYDFPAVLRDKWALLKHAGGN